MINLERYKDNHTINYLKFLVGLRPPSTRVTKGEQDYLIGFARGRRCIVEVGVFEAATSRVFCAVMDASGKLYLVDPYYPTVRLERFLNTSFTQQIAKRAVKSWRGLVEFVREPSHVAAQKFSAAGSADFVFIDAAHDYESVRQDFESWAPTLSHDGVIAFHDSRPCPTRPEIVPDDGPARLLGEIQAGRYGAWEVIGYAESVTAIRPRRGST